MNTLFPEDKTNDLTPIDKGYGIKKISESQIGFYLFDKLLKVIPITPQLELRIFVIDLVLRFGLKKSRISKALNISRQSIDNWLDIYHLKGLAGLNNNPRGFSGNKARQLEAQRKAEREEAAGQQLKLNFCFDIEGGEKKIENEEIPFSTENDWKATRYAGVFIYQIALVSVWDWFRLIIGYFGNQYKLFQAFLLMVSRDIGSIEQIKNVVQHEAGLVLGLKQFPSRGKMWELFYQVFDQRRSKQLLKDFFRYQILNGIVNLWYWFIDGHRLSYTGKHKVHHTYNTQRRMPEPGRTNMVVCDIRGNIVDFEIQDGKGDLKSFVVGLNKRWEGQLYELPVKVFDREGDGKGFFSKMVLAQNSFVTWEKNADDKKLKELADDKFYVILEVNGTEYGAFEEERHYSYEYDPYTEGAPEKEHKFTLRRIYLWNKSNGHRTSGLAYDHNNKLSTADCAYAILNRWGASENTFKHAQARHPYNYQPGYRMSESEQQTIANPLVKETKKLIKRLNLQTNKLYKKLAVSKKSLKKDGTPRKNSLRENLKNKISEKETELTEAQQLLKEIPERVDLSSVKNGKSFKSIDNEGKNLFDFVTSAAWNARNKIIDMLEPYYHNKNEIVDLFYAISNCHGWIKSTKDTVTVRIEPLQQAGRRAAQIQLCKQLTAMGAQTPSGKFLVIEVGESPFNNVQKN
jgi:transposase